MARSGKASARSLPSGKSVPKIVSKMDGSDRSRRAFSDTPKGKGSSKIYRGPRKGMSPVPKPGRSK